MKEEFGDSFINGMLQKSRYLPGDGRNIFTDGFIDRHDEVTQVALSQTIAFLRERLTESASASG